jgi:Flp pilus assembly protein TadB
MLLALFVLLFLVIAPAAPRVSLERRRAPGASSSSGLTAVTNRAENVVNSLIRRHGRAPFSEDELEQAGIRLPPAGFLLMVLSAATVLALVGVLVGNGTVWALILALVGAALAPLGARLLLKIRADRRRAAFANQLDETLGLLAGGLRAGHSLMSALDAAAHETELPTSEELTRVINETRIGRDVGEALENTAERMQSQDFHWVVQAIAINRAVGGNLSQVLDQVGHTVRERNEIRRQVIGLAAEGKMSGWVLVLLPIGVFLFLLLSQPLYFAGFLGSIWGITALVVAAVLLVLGSVWIKAAVTVRF